MGYTFVQKMLAWKSGTNAVKVGQTVVVEPDYVVTHDNTAAIVKTFEEIGPGVKVRYPERHIIVLDHCTPAASETHAKNHQIIRKFVIDYGIKNFHDINEGICHQIVAEKYAAPGLLILGSDSHTVMAGAFSTLAVPIDRVEAAGLFATGKTWLMVPSTIKVELKGKFRPEVGAKDLILRFIGDVSASGADYRSVEFLGSGVTSLSMDDRMVIANMIIEAGGKCAYFPPDRKTRRYLQDQGRSSVREILPDRNAEYERILSYNLDEIDPMVALPHTVDNVKPVKDISETKIDQVLIGTCTNGRISDLRIAAKILEGKHIAQNVRLLILPASRKILLQAVKEGLIQVFVKAGGVVINPGCGPCMGNHEGILAPGERCVSTSNRNFKGRMGCNESFIYLSGPQTAAFAAINGVITNPTGGEQ